MPANILGISSLLLGDDMESCACVMSRQLAAATRHAIASPAQVLSRQEGLHTFAKCECHLGQHRPQNGKLCSRHTTLHKADPAVAVTKASSPRSL